MFGGKGVIKEGTFGSQRTIQWTIPVLQCSGLAMPCPMCTLFESVVPSACFYIAYFEELFQFLPGIQDDLTGLNLTIEILLNPTLTSCLTSLPLLIKAVYLVCEVNVADYCVTKWFYVSFF